MRLIGATADAGLASLGLAASDATADTQRLLGLIRQLGLELLVEIAAPPSVWLCVTVDPVLQCACVGKGWAAADAVRRCLAELAERRSARARGDEASVRDDAPAVPGLAPSFGFSAEQQAARTELNARWDGFEIIPDPAANAGPAAAWVWVEPLAGGRPHLAPAAVCYEYASTNGGAVFAPAWDSTGCAAAPDLAAATRSALLEIIERDAGGIWWYGRCRRPGLRIDAETSPKLAAALAARPATRPAWLLDLTHDLGPAVIAAVSCDPERGLPAIGLAASTDAVDAAERAFLELCQSELNLRLCLQRWSGRAKSPRDADDRRLETWLAKMTSESIAWMRPAGEKRLADVVGREPDLRALQANGLSAWRLDLTRADLGVPVARVLVPGAASLRPRLESRRLVDVPVALGWQPPGFILPDLGALPMIGF